MDYNVLKTEVKTDPLALGYAGKTDAQVAAMLNTPNRNKQGPVAAVQLLRWAAATDGIQSLKSASASGTPAKRALADAALAMLSSPHVSQLDVVDPEVAGFLAACVTAGIFTQANVDALKARGVYKISRAQELGIDDAPIGAGSVADARRMP